MGKKMAILITVGLTVFVLGTAAVIAANVNRVPNPPEGLATVTPSVSQAADTTVEALLARDAQYRERLEEANRVIQQANETIASLQADQATLQSQHEILLERETLYQQEIAKANRLLEQQAAAPQSFAAAPQVAAQPPAPPAPAPVATPAPAPVVPSREDEHHDDSEHEDEHESEHEDDD